LTIMSCPLASLGSVSSIIIIVISLLLSYYWYYRLEFFF